MGQVKKTEFRALGTDISVQIVFSDNRDELDSGKIFESIKKLYADQEKIFSRFDPKSELSRLNQNLGTFQTTSCDIIEAAEKALFYWKKTDGFFDPRIITTLESIGYKSDFRSIDFSETKASFGGDDFSGELGDELKIENGKIFLARRMDFSGVVKGWITDRAAKMLSERGIENALIDSGGDIRVIGKDENGENWRISVEGLSEEKIILELDKEFGGVATSGISRRKWEVGGTAYHHLINPKFPGKFSFDLRSVSVIGKTVEEADVWAKALFLIGKEKGLKFAQEKRIFCFFIDYRGNIYLSPGVKEHIIVDNP